MPVLKTAQCDICHADYRAVNAKPEKWLLVTLSEDDFSRIEISHFDLVEYEECKGDYITCNRDHAFEAVDLLLPKLLES